MFDNNVFISGSCRNYKDDRKGIVAGFQLETNITYYRGIPLSMIEYIRVYDDGVELPNEDIRVSIDQNDWFSLKEVETVTSYKWEYGDPLYIRVLKEGGLTPGTHRIKLVVATRTAYIPAPLEGIREEDVIIPA